MGVPQARWMVVAKSHLEMDDNWGYPVTTQEPNVFFFFFIGRDSGLRLVMIIPKI